MKEILPLRYINASCGDLADGSVSINPNNTEAEYSYSINNGVTVQNSGLFTGLGVSTGSGTEMYIILIENQFGSSLSIDVEISKEECEIDCTDFVVLFNLWLNLFRGSTDEASP